MSYAVLFAGQASQHPSMLPWLETEPASARLLQDTVSRLGTDWREQLGNPLRASDNAFAQLLITGTSLAAWAALQALLPAPPLVVAGYSVGELAAFACAGVFSAAQALELAQQRAAAMDLAARGVDSGLLSVSGLSETAALAACPGLKLECAIRVSVTHSILAGSDQALQQALALLQAHGAHCTRLAVRLASHSSWMAAAEGPFGRALQGLRFEPPACPVAVNALGTLSRQPEELRQALSRQLARTVQWSSCLQAVAERQPDCVIEIGAGTALSRMWNERYPDIAARALDDFRNPSAAVQWIARRSVS